MTITNARVARFAKLIDELLELWADLDKGNKNEDARQQLGYAKTNLKLARHAVAAAGKEGNK